MDLTIPGLDSLQLAGKRVLVRVDFNVPQDEKSGAITDDTRIRAALPTIQRILAAGGKPVLMSHLGRPKDGPDPLYSMKPVGQRLQELLGAKHPVITLGESTGPAVAAAIQKATAGSVVLLENVRFHPKETKGDAKLAQEFAALGDVFVNDAFGSAHRDHSSVCGPARHLPSAGGLLLQKEIDAFQRVLNNPARPFAAILGGAKVSDKLKVIDNLLDKVDRLLIGGGMAYTFLKAQGREIGSSLFQADQLELVQKAIQKAKTKGVQLLLPSDHLIGQAFSESTPIKAVEGDIPAGWMGLDIGPKTRAAYAQAIAGAKTVVWNGPMGVFEWKSCEAGTKAVGEAVANCPGYTVVGGGDSVAAAEKFHLTERLAHISTGGGASLELLEGILLPGIAVLQKR
jgi:phosphoglycerate kinase